MQSSSFIHGGNQTLWWNIEYQVNAIYMSNLAINYTLCRVAGPEPESPNFLNMPNNIICVLKAQIMKHP